MDAQEEPVHVKLGYRVPSTMTGNINRITVMNSLNKYMNGTYIVLR